MSDVTQWAIVPSCMVPTAQTVREGKYVTTAGVVKFAVGQSGSIVFNATITTSLPAGQYNMRAYLERDDPPRLDILGTNAQLWRRANGVLGAGVEHVLAISGEGLPLLGQNGVYVVDSPPGQFPGGINIQDYWYWVQLEVQQASPAIAETRNAVIGLELISG
jgi:hypothetical protein